MKTTKSMKTSVMNEFKTRYPNVDIAVVSYVSKKAADNHNELFEYSVKRGE